LSPLKSDGDRQIAEAEIDLGAEKRQLVAGIGSYLPDQIIGRESGSHQPGTESIRGSKARE
jgi:hypothetical protein